MDFQATFSNQSGQAKTLDIKDGFNLQDAYNVVANDDFAPTQINLEPINMNSSYSNVEPDKQVETAYDLARYSINDIIDKHKISSDELAVLLEEGTNHELEHISSYLIAMKIAQDHLYEDLMYYSKIKSAMLARGMALNMSKATPKYAVGTKFSYPIYVRLKANVDKFAVMNFLRQYPKVEDVMNRYVRTPNVKAGYLAFMADKDANDQNLEQWGAKVKGYYESADGIKIKRYEWNFGEAEGFAEVFQFVYDKYNGYAKGGVMSNNYSEKMMSSAYAMPFQDWFNKNHMDVTESYNDAKRDYEDSQNKSFEIKLGKYAKSLYKEFAKNNKFKDGGDVDNKNYYRAVTQDLGLQTTFVPKNRYEAFDIEGNPITRGASDVFMLSDKLEISASKSVGGAILGLWSMYNSNGINPVGKKVYVYAITNKPSKDLSRVRMADFEYLKEVRYDEPISAKRVGYFEYDQKFNEDALNFYGRISDDDPYSEIEYDIDAWEDFERYILTLDISDLVIDNKNPNIRFDKGGDTNRNFNDKELLKRYKKGESIGFTAIAHLKAQGLIERSDGTKRKSINSFMQGGLIASNGELNNLTDGTNTIFNGTNPDIRFDKGGYVSEQRLIENNIGKIDDIYVFSENDEPIKSLGEFTLQGFGKYMMKDLAGELYSDYKIRLRSDFAIMLGNDVIKPSIKVAQMKGNRIELLAIIYNAMVSEEQAVSYVYNSDGEVAGKFTDEDFAEDMVNNNDGYYSEVRVEELETPETILAMQFDFKKHEMTFISTLLEKQSTHKFKYGGKL